MCVPISRLLDLYPLHAYMIGFGNFLVYIIQCRYLEMEAVKVLITEILPTISESKQHIVLDSLAAMGFEQLGDLQYFDCEKNLSSILNTLETRKLAAKLKLHFNSISS
jgi:hypothetical protein